MKKNHDIIDLKIQIEHATDKAVLVKNLKGEKVCSMLSVWDASSYLK